MNDLAIAKLTRKLKDRELATALVSAGYTNPAKIRKAKTKDLEKAIGKDKAAKAREKFKERGA